MIDSIDITYHITCQKDQNIEKLSRDIALEQTVEFPDELITSDEIKDNIIGSIKDISPIKNKYNTYKAVIGYNPDITGYQTPQFLNLLFGNISIKKNIKVVDINFPRKFINEVNGPLFGIEGIRRLLGVYNRPLFSTVLKPMGLSSAELASIAEAFALGGGDIVKDDHGLIEHSFCPFKERVKRCQDVIDRVNSKTGRKTLYFPNILARVDEVEEQVQFAKRHGVQGILMSPFLVGQDLMRYLAEKYNLIVMAHPAFTGTNFHDFYHGITPAVLLGTVFRLLGADISIYPNTGGRFSFSLKECEEINNNLRTPLGNLKTTFPAPAGGMNLDNLQKIAPIYGEDTIYLIGGALHGFSKDLTYSTKKFMDSIRIQFNERLTKSELTGFSSCELSELSNEKGLSEYLSFEDSFKWKGRKIKAYKNSEQLDFKKISRQELIGKYGENTQFDLRYFQIEPVGYSSLEIHVHEHVIICIKGKGVLINGDERRDMKPFDIAYIPTMQVHQLRNEGNESFGFFCIVDHKRDRPVSP